MTPSRVALVCPYSWGVPGGVQSHVAGLAAALRRRGVAADILAPLDGGGEDGIVPLGRTVGFRDNGSVTRVTLTPAAVARTARAVRSGRYDVVHAHEPMLPAAGLTAVVAADVPVVGTFHMVNESALWYRLFRPVVRPAARRLAARIAVSETARSFVAQVLPGHYEIIPNGVDIASQTPVGPRSGSRVVFVGRADPRKGLDVLLRAFERLPASAELDLVGVAPGDLAAADERVHAHGRVSDDERRRLVAGADVLCAPSLRGESFGVVLVEGMAAGLPVVASDLPGYREVVSETCGRLVPPGDADELAAVLARLLADGKLRRELGEAGRREAARYDWNAVADRILGVYERVLK